MRAIRTCVLATLMLGLQAGAAQAADPVLDPPGAGNGIVTGTADPAAAPITIYDVSYDTPAAIGSGRSIDSAGNFAVSVSPPLIDGNNIIAEDAQGRQSVPTLIERIVHPAAGQ